MLCISFYQFMIIWIICVHGWCRLEHHLKRTVSNQFPTLPCWVLLCSASSHGIWESFANGASRGPDIERCFGCVPPEDVVIHVHNTGIYWVCLAIFCKEKQFFFFKCLSSFAFADLRVMSEPPTPLDLSFCGSLAARTLWTSLPRAVWDRR